MLNRKNGKSLSKIFNKLNFFWINLSNKRKIQYLQKKGCKIDNSTRLNCDINTFGSEPYLITIGRDCLIAENVRFITHDGGIKVLNTLNRFDGKRMNKIAKINVGNNTYIGMDAFVMPGVTIGNNCIIGAKSVVTKDIPNNSVVVGCPARVIYDIDEYLKRAVEKNMIYEVGNMSYLEKRIYFESLDSK